ncbi:metallopeptidase TldD-related protein [Stutzerimonas stutzeri]|uniref:metallopeptidase TldD-related protein n=1 Tax=Stutzerimonas stutzeri TaxID=316 RepID=UPI00210CCB05|nr:metallopeptidase TldD-related protein [Stutzerimonas stutzeri]MCQ4319743.1 metallopeptidase TldD-related protein [Stutzerimonas stutzeri]
MIALSNTTLAREHFQGIRETLRHLLSSSEHFSLWYVAEASDFVRFNHGRVRQAGQVGQIEATLSLANDGRHANVRLTLQGDLLQDKPKITTAVTRLRSIIGGLQPDPYLQLNSHGWTNESSSLQPLLEPGQAIDQIAAVVAGRDLVGFYASGPIYYGYADSADAFGWHAVSQSTFEWSLFDTAGRAVRAEVTGPTWDPAAFETRMQQADRHLQMLGKPVRVLQPGAYRAYLAPAALGELLGLISRSAFSANALRTASSPLQQLFVGQRSLSPRMGLSEQVSGSLSPAFTCDGRIRDDLRLIEHGKLVGELVSARSAREYGLIENGSEPREVPRSLSMDAGTVKTGQVLTELDTGLYIGNLWYVNHSDLSSARLTGMTRYATFWVEQGRIVAPVDTMRFDDSLYHFLGQHLLGLTEARELLPSNSTYGRRSTESMLLPGALTDRFVLTL